MVSGKDPPSHYLLLHISGSIFDNSPAVVLATMTVITIVLTILDWLCVPFSQPSRRRVRTRAPSRGVWADSGVLWIDPPLDPSFRVYSVRHTDGAGNPPPIGPPEAFDPYPPGSHPDAGASPALLPAPPPSPTPSLKWVCPPLDPSFRVYSVRHIGVDMEDPGLLANEPPKKWESDSESEEDVEVADEVEVEVEVECPPTPPAKPWERPYTAAVRRRGPRPVGPRRPRAEAWSTVVEGR